MPKLNQIVALVSAKKGRAASAIAEQLTRLQKNPLLQGIAKVYQPKDDDGSKLPAESKIVQVKALQAFDAASAEIRDVLDLVLTQDVGNADAFADVVVGGVRLLAGAPVSYLLYLEKKLKEIESFVGQLPTLDPAETWKYDEVSDCYATPSNQTVRTKKVPRNHVKAAATAQHPAQVETYMEDVVDGYWNTTHFSGAIPVQLKNAMLSRVRCLQDAVKVAREEANGTEVKHCRVGDSIFQYIRDGKLS